MALGPHAFWFFLVPFKIRIVDMNPNGDVTHTFQNISKMPSGIQFANTSVLMGS
jgi:hypothetical protein